MPTSGYHKSNFLNDYWLTGVLNVTTAYSPSQTFNKQETSAAREELLTASVAQIRWQTNTTRTAVAKLLRVDSGANVKSVKLRRSYAFSCK
jgi:hypothetical protein